MVPMQRRCEMKQRQEINEFLNMCTTLLVYKVLRRQRSLPRSSPLSRDRSSWEQYISHMIQDQTFRQRFRWHRRNETATSDIRLIVSVHLSHATASGAVSGVGHYPVLAAKFAQDTRQLV